MFYVEKHFFTMGDIFDKVHFRDLFSWLTALIDASPIVARPKSWPTYGVLWGHLLSQNHVPKVYDLGPPPLNKS